MSDSYGAALPPRGSYDPYENAEAIRRLQRHARMAGTVTLTASAATTVVSNEYITADTVIGNPCPTTANAAAEQAAGTMYVSDVSRGQFTITHANNAQTDRTFYWQGK